MGGSGCARARAWSFSSWWLRVRICSGARASVWCACACLCVSERVDPCVHSIACVRSCVRAPVRWRTASCHCTRPCVRDVLVGGRNGARILWV